MSNYIVDGADLTDIAEAIRAKGGTSAQLQFPSGFVDAVEAIETGGGGASATGSFTVTSSYITSKVITHNLGTNHVFGIIWVEPDENNQIVCPGGFDVFFGMFVSKPYIDEVTDASTVLVCNYTSDATKTVVRPSYASGYFRMIKSPWTNKAASWSSQESCIFNLYCPASGVTANSVTIQTNPSHTYMRSHTYHWKIWALDGIGS